MPDDRKVESHKVNTPWLIEEFTGAVTSLGADDTHIITLDDGTKGYGSNREEAEKDARKK